MNFSVFKSVQQFIPNIQLFGSNEISFDSIKLLNNKIDIYSSIMIYDNCNNQQIELNEDEYDVTWSVEVNNNNNNIIKGLDALETYLLSQSVNNVDSLSIDASTLLQSGLMYTFIMNFKCIDTTFDCDVDTKHVLIYKSNDIICKIQGGDINLNGVKTSHFEQQNVITLNGDKFTYDPDKNETLHLKYSWDCIDIMENGMDCDYLLHSKVSSVLNIDSISLIIDIRNDDNSPDLLIISVTAITDKMLIRNFESRDSIDNSLNLILKSNVLTEGTSYSFQLTIYQNDGNNNNELIAFGESSVITIYVFSKPVIIDNSFTIKQKCSSYSSINEYLSISYDLSVIGDGDNVPLLYEFVYRMNDDDDDININYIHSNLLSIPYLDNIYLPIGDIELISNVYDRQSSFASDTISCIITLNSYKMCPESHDEFKVKSYLTDYEKYNDIVQRLMVYLKYLYDHSNEIDNIYDCLQKRLLSVLSILNIEITELCDNNLIDIFYTKQYMEIVETLIFRTLDPCLFITDNIKNDVESLEISRDSIITNIVAIYYEDNDITPSLSTIIVYDTYKFSKKKSRK